MRIWGKGVNAGNERPLHAKEKKNLCMKKKKAGTEKEINAWWIFYYSLQHQADEIITGMIITIIQESRLL